MTDEQEYQRPDLLQGLCDGEPVALDVLFATHKAAVVNLIAATGGSSADGAVFLKQPWKNWRNSTSFNRFHPIWI
ncbi:MAG: hypothetical protein IPL65_00140 [Lewinellaceae bacterium]|nr:hypothetical protein [Lewinellaceae bacterium]